MATETMHSPIDAIWDWSYEIERSRLHELYLKAKRDQWNADVALDWALPVDPGGKILDAERMAFLQLAFFRRLDARTLEAFNARYSAWILSQLLHGEQGALMVAGELVAAVPDYEAKLYVASQAMDEARHVEVFSRYIRKLDKIYPVQPVLRSLLSDIMQTPHWQAKMVGMQVILEGLALGTFLNVKAATGCSLLRSLLTYVTKDEARHVAFGSMYLTTEIAAMHADDRAAVEDFACTAMKKMVSMRRGMEGMAGFDQVLVESGIDPSDFVAALQSEVAAGFKLSATPGNVHTVKSLIMPGIVRAGLVSDRVKPSYEAAGIQLFADTRVLEAFEDSGEVAG
ncbi:MAG: ferritin-like domain-containing protein [Polyangiaceae bacterium]